MQEELKILRLMVSVLTEGELEIQETELTRRMNDTKDKKTQTAGALAEAKREVDQFRDSYEIVLAEDKALDKAFKKEFADQDMHTVEQLYKLFKRRPRWVGYGTVMQVVVLKVLNKVKGVYWATGVVWWRVGYNVPQVVLAVLNKVKGIQRRGADKG